MDNTRREVKSSCRIASTYKENQDKEEADGAVDPADIVSKHVPNDVLNIHLPVFGLHREAGRRSIAPTVAKESCRNSESELTS